MVNPAPNRSQNESAATDIAEVARTYRDNHHWVPLRLKGKLPNCMGDGWQKRTLKDAVPEFEAGDNIGVLLGTPSGDVVRLDPDFPVIPAMVEKLFPEPSMTFGRKSSPRSGRLLICKGIKTTNFQLPDSIKDDARLPLHDGKPNLMVFQILSTGAQTVVPPSVHSKSAEKVVWEINAPLATLDSKVLLRRVGIEAFCMAVRQFWPARGSRNEAAMALARVLLEAVGTGTDEQRIGLVDDLVLAVAMAGGDGQASRDGKQRAEATLAKMKAGEDTIGMTRLLELLELPSGVAKTFRKWLDITGIEKFVLNWRERRKSGEPVPSMYNARLAIDALGVECRYDTFHNKILFGFRGDDVRHEIQSMLGEVTDNGIIRLRQIMSERFGFDLEDKATRDAVKSLALEHCFDPVCDMLDEAEAAYDGKKRLDRFAVDYLNCADTPLNRAFGRKTLIAAVRRARQPGCKFDTVLTLESAEGWNKSSIWRVMAGDENFSDERVIGKNSREVQEQLSEIWIHENADLAGMKKTEVETVKAYASRSTDIARPAFGHFVEKKKRHSIEVATTNSDEYLQSQTGNRRFWPVRVLNSIDLDLVRRNRLQLWGEAAKCESAGESITLDGSMWADAGIEQEKRRTKDPWEDVLSHVPDFVNGHVGFNGAVQRVQIIHRESDGDSHQREMVSSSDLLTHVLRVPTGQQETRHSMKLATVMKLLGWQRPEGDKVTVGGNRVRGYFRRVEVPFS